MLTHSHIAGSGHEIWIQPAGPSGAGLTFDVHIGGGGIASIASLAHRKATKGRSFVINGTFFFNGSILGDMLRRDGHFRKTAEPKAKKRFGFAITTFGQPTVYEREPLPDDPTQLEAVYTAMYSMAMGGLGRLLEGGVNKAARSILKDPAGQYFQDDAIREAPRSALGIDNRGRVMVFVATPGPDPANYGMTPDEMAVFMKARGVTDAVFLDGGRSTSLAVNGRVLMTGGNYAAGGNDSTIPCWVIGYE